MVDVSPRHKRKTKARLTKSGLTLLQDRFVEAYCGDARFNGTQAAIAAGYSTCTARRQATENMSLPHIREAIALKLADRSMDKPEWLTRLRQIASIDHSELEDCYYYEEREGQQPYRRVDLAKIRQRGLGQLMQGINCTRSGEVIIWPDRLRAHELIGKAGGWLIDKHELKLTYPIEEYEDPQQLAAIERGEDPGPPRKRGTQGQNQPQLEGPTVIETTGSVEVEGEKGK